MTSSLRRVLLTLAATGAMSAASAQVVSKLTTANEALEVPAGSITLPLSSTSAAVFAPCGGCAVKSFPTTASTAYYLKSTPVTAADLKAAIVGKPDLILTVKYSVKTGELVSVTADVDGPPPTQRRTP